MRRILAYLILPILLIGPACQQQPDAPVINFTQYRAAFTDAVTAYFLRCGMLDASRKSQLAQMSLLAVPPELQSTIDKEVAKGQVRLTTDCFAPLKDATCDVNDAFATISSCLTGGKQYLPQVTAGKLCLLQGECIDGYCDLGAIKSKPCGMGVCRPYLKTGTQCGTGKGQCNPDKESCWMSACRTRGGPGADCTADADCNLESFCRSDTSNKRSCTARQKNLATGSSCDSAQLPDGCKVGDRCIESVPGMGDFACRTGRSEGGGCYTPLDCAGGLACAGANLAMSKQGQCRKQGGIGASCADGAVCQLTLYCGKDNTCKPSTSTGSSCEAVSFGQACLSGTCTATDVQSGNCQDPKADGSNCTTALECGSGSCDSSGHCGTVCAPLR